MMWMVRMLGAVLRKSLGWFAMILARCGGMFTATSTSPFWSAATRTASSGIGRETTVLIFACPRQWVGTPSSEISSSLLHRARRYGPVPIGFFEMNGLSLPAYALGGYIEACRWVSATMKIGHGLLVWTLTV